MPENIAGPHLPLGNSPERIDTPKGPVSGTYHGLTVTEDYRWLEDARSEQTRSWTLD
jgi:hypothetical protein